MVKAAQFISYGLGLYVLIGLFFGLWFVTKGIKDQPLEGRAIILRLMLLPAALLLWPILVGRKDASREASHET